MSALEPVMERHADYEAAHIAPFCLARVGGVSAQWLGELPLHETARLIRTALAAEAALQAITPPVEEALYRLVPQAGGDQALRRRILAVKRHVHNLRIWPEAATDLPLVTAALRDEAERTQLLEWHRLAAQRDVALAQAARAYPPEVDAAARALSHHMHDPDLQTGLSVASQSVLADLRRALINYRPEDWRPTSKLARSSLAYFTRAALKTSPLSTFTQLAVATFEGGARSAECGMAERLSRTQHSALRTRNIVRLVRTLPLSWLTLISRDRDLAPALCFEPNAGFCRRAGDSAKVILLTTEYTHHDLFAGRLERVVERQFDRQRVPELTQFLEAGRRSTYRELTSMLAATGRISDPHQALIQLLDMQLVRPVAPYSQLDSEPSLKLADALAQVRGERATRVAGRLRHIHGLVAESRDAGGAGRLKILDQIRQTAALVFEDLGSPPPPWLNYVGLIYEDVRYDGPQIPLGPSIQSDLARVAEELRPKIIRTHMYDYLYGHFVRRFGPAGETDDILGFLQDFLAREDLGEIIDRAIAEDRWALKGPGTNARARLPVGPGAMSPAVTVFFQIAAESEEALRRGDYKLVVNETGSGQGGLLGRFIDLLGPAHGDLASRLAAWVKSTHGDCPVLEMPVMSDWNGLHQVLGITGQVLKWPGECPTTEGEEGDERVETSRLRDLRLRANAEDATLYFVDRAGRVVAPSYLGLVPAAMLRDALGVLLLLIDPWVCDSQVGARRERFTPPSAPPSGVEFFPRQEVGRVVLRRARWRFPAAQVPVRQRGESDFDFFARVQGWRAEHDLPEEVFAAVERSGFEFEAKYRKPIWVHFGSPHSLELLRQIVAEDAVAVTLTEALPGRHQHWVQAPAAYGTDLERRVSEFIGLVRWPMPAAPSSARSAALRANGMAIQVKRHQADWLYYKIYPAKFDQLEDIIRHIVGPARDLARAGAGLDRWFFVRYLDRRGPHVRLRLRGPARLCQALRSEIDRLVERALPLVKSAPRPPIFLADDESLLAVETAPGYTTAQYEPEYEKYGGPAGIAIAEQLFEVSSELALKALSLEQELGLDRTLLSLRLMQLLVQGMEPDQEAQTRFLQNYMWYWSGQDREAACLLRARFEQAAWQRRCDLPRELETFDSDPAIKALIAEYSEAVAATIRALAAATESVSVPAPRLCFDYLHMNNNRLGVRPREEGYLVALLLAMSRPLSGHSQIGWPLLACP